MKATLRCYTKALDDMPCAVHTFDGPAKTVAEKLWLTLKAFNGRAVETDFEFDGDVERDEFTAGYQALVPDCDQFHDHGWAGLDVTE